MKFHEFLGIKGKWGTKTVKVQYPPDMSPYHGEAFLLPQVHKAALCRKLRGLVILDVLEFQLDSKGAASMFIIPKKNGTTRFISNF